MCHLAGHRFDNIGDLLAISHNNDSPHIPIELRNFIA